MKKNKHLVKGTDFSGFSRNPGKEHFFYYPAILGYYWDVLSGSEQKVLDFILRKTYGFQKLDDKISLSQFVKGDGVNTNGCGVGKTQVVACLVSLEEKGFISVKRKFKSTNHIYLKLVDSEDDKTFTEDTIATAEERELIMLFKPYAKHLIESYLVNEQEIKAIRNLLTHYNYDAIKAVIDILGSTNKEQYMPKITSPSQLYKKLSSLISAIETAQMEHYRYSHFDSDLENYSEGKAEDNRCAGIDKEDDDDNQFLF